MISANGGLPAHRYTPQVTPRWPRGSERASAVSVLPPAGGGVRSFVTPYFGGGVGQGAQLPPPLSRVRRLGRHLRRRLCGSWGCGGGGLCRR